MAWSAVLLASLSAGEWSDRDARTACGLDISGDDAIRLACLAPLVAAASSHPAALLAAASATAALGWCAGSRARDARAVSQGIVCEDPWAPSRRRMWRTGTCLRITAWPRVSGTQWRAPAMLVAAGDFGSDAGVVGPRVGDGVMVSGEGPPPHMWQLVLGDLACHVPRRAAVPGSFSSFRFLRGRGLAWEGRLIHPASVVTGVDPLTHASATLLAPLRQAVIGRLDRLFPPDESLLLRSVLLGERCDEMRLLRSSYAVLGLGHLFAVSGLHVGLVAGILLLLLRFMRAGFRGRFVSLTLFLAGYVLLVGMPGSALRAAALLITAALSNWAGRRHDGLRTLGLLVWAWAVFAPPALSDAGLRLSLGAAAGIVVMLRVVTPRLDRGRRIRHWLGNALAVSLGAQLGALPETARSFGWLHPMATSFNLAAVPLFGGAVWLAAGAILLSPVAWLAGALSAVSWLMLRLLSAGTVGSSSLAEARLGLPAWDHRAAVLYVAGLAGLGLLLSGRQRRTRLAGALAATCLLAIPFCGRTLCDGEMTAIQFDVGQGDCAALVFPDRSAVLVDTGEAWRDTGPFLRDVRPWLRREGIDSLAGAVLTHHHADHDGACDQLHAAMDVKAWWLGGRTTAPAPVARDRVSHPVPGDTLYHVGDWALVCIATAGPDAQELEENDRSLAVALCWRGGVRGLWTGDLERAGERTLLAAAPLTPSAPIDVLKAGHHGSRTSSTPAFLDAFRPATVLISCGLENRHRHPSHGPFTAGGDTLRGLRTDLDGTIIIRWRDGGPPRIRTGVDRRPPRLDTRGTGT